MRGTVFNCYQWQCSRKSRSRGCCRILRIVTTFAPFKWSIPYKNHPLLQSFHPNKTPTNWPSIHRILSAATPRRLLHHTRCPNTRITTPRAAITSRTSLPPSPLFRKKKNFPN